MRTKKTIATKWGAVSLPKPLIDDITRFVDEVGYWPSISSFVREAAIEKLHSERMKRKAEEEGRQN